MTQLNPEGSTSDSQRILTEIRELKQSFEKLNEDVEKFNDRFTNYQQATQWVVQLAFTLIASATLTIIITSVLR